jgi:geranylgeranyl reductase family protein
VVTTDVLVVGAGPAGSAAAATLARAGRHVTLVDKARFPRDKCCGDGLTAGALRLCERLGLDPADVPSWTVVDETWLRSPSGREVALSLPAEGQFSVVARRMDLDAALARVAASAGASLHEGAGIEAIRQSDDGVVAEVGGLGPVTARYVVAADGMWSPTRKLLGVNEPGYLGEWHAFRQYVTGVTGPARHRQYVWFEPDVLPGYVWSFPLPAGPDGRGVVNFGFGVPRDGRAIQDMKETWASLWERPHLREALGPDAVAESRHLAWPIPARIDRAVLAKGRALFAGDAASATDVMTGEGIAQALLTGMLAAEAIVAGGAEQPGWVADRYRWSVRRELVADHRMSVALGWVLRHDWGARGAVRVVGRSDWTRRNFARWMFEDEPRAIALTPRRWHRRFLTRPGAYE